HAVWRQPADPDQFHQTSYQFYAQYDLPILGCLSVSDRPMNDFPFLALAGRWRYSTALEEWLVLHQSNAEFDPAVLNVPAQHSPSFFPGLKKHLLLNLPKTCYC